MAFTDNCDIFASFHEDGLNQIIHHIQHQRPSLFNYGSAGVIVNNELLCEKIEAHPVVSLRGNPLITRMAYLPIPRSSFGLEWAIQILKPEIDFHPGNRFDLPQELGPLREQRFSMRLNVCAGLGCPRDINVDDYIDPPILNPEEKRDKPKEDIPIKPLPTRQLTCFCLDVFAVGGVKIKTYHNKPYLEPFVERLEIVDIRPQELENALECYVELILKLGIMPGLRILLERSALEIIEDVASIVFKPTPISAQVPNNPAIENDQLKAFIDLEVV